MPEISCKTARKSSRISRNFLITVFRIFCQSLVNNLLQVAAEAVRDAYRRAASAFRKEPGGARQSRFCLEKPRFRSAFRKAERRSKKYRRDGRRVRLSPVRARRKSPFRREFRVRLFPCGRRLRVRSAVSSCISFARPKSRIFACPLFGHHYVSGFDVAVNNAARMRVGERVAHLDGDAKARFSVRAGDRRRAGARFCPRHTASQYNKCRLLR